MCALDFRKITTNINCMRAKLQCICHARSLTDVSNSNEYLPQAAIFGWKISSKNDL